MGHDDRPAVPGPGRGPGGHVRRGPRRRPRRSRPLTVKDATVQPERFVDRTLVVIAHPDDAEFWLGGTIAAWTAAGTAGWYPGLSDGGPGGGDPAPGAARAPARSPGAGRRGGAP